MLVCLCVMIMGHATLLLEMKDMHCNTLPMAKAPLMLIHCCITVELPTWRQGHLPPPVSTFFVVDTLQYTVADYNIL